MNRVGSLLVLVAFFALSCHAAVNESPYRAGREVKLYHKYEFEPKTASYWEKLALNTVLPVVIVGVVCFLVIVFWSCYRCCGKCRPNERSFSDRYKIFIAVMIALIAIACIGMLIYGFEADKTQSSAFRNVPELIDNIILWKENSIMEVEKLLNVTNRTLEGASRILANSSFCGVGGAITGPACSEISNVINNATRIVTDANQLINGVGTTQLQSAKDSISKQAVNADDYRHLVMIILLAVMFSVLVVQALIALTDSRCPPSRQVRQFCLGKFFTCLITFTVIILVLLMWLLAAMLLFTSVLFADFCIAPADNIISASGISEPITQYYLKCQDEGYNQTNPLEQYLNGINVARNKSLESVESARTTAQGCTLNAFCSSAITAIDNVKTDVQAVFDTVGTVDGNSNAGTGILKQFSCKTLNGLIQAVFHLICDDFFLSASQTFEVFIAFAGLLVLLQIFIGISPHRKDKEDPATVRPTIYGYGNDPNATEMKPPSYSDSNSGHVMYGSDKATHPV